LNNWNKYILAYLWGESVIQEEDFSSVDFNANLTEYNALVFTTRLLANTYGCVQIKSEAYFTEKQQTYDVAYEKALINNNSTSNSDDLITRENYYELIYKALHAENTRGSIVGEHSFKYIDLFSYGKRYDIVSEGKTPIFNENYAPKTLDTVGEKFKYIVFVLKDDYPGINEANATVVIQGEEMAPGIYTCYQRQWVAESISLAKGELFKENSYYLFSSYEHRYRKTDYNTAALLLFEADKTSNTLYDIHEAGNILFHTNIQGEVSRGVVYTDEVRIQEVRVEGDAAFGFTIYITPESSDVFEVVEGSAPR
jgi:hypothetical protein